MKPRVKLWRIVVIALALDLPLTRVFGAASRMKAPSPAPAVLAPIPSLNSNIWLPATPPALNSPGIYNATPNSMLVVVPKSIDPQSIHTPDLSQFKMPCLNPSVSLEKR